MPASAVRRSRPSRKSATVTITMRGESTAGQIRIRTPTRIPTRARGRIHARDRSASRSAGERVCCIRLGSAVARRMSCARRRYCSIRAVAERSRVGVGSVVR